MTIQDADIIDEKFNRLGDPGESFASKLAGGIDNLTKDAKAGLVSEALIFADVVKDPAEMRTNVAANRQSLNEFFDIIDYKKLVESNDDVLLSFKQRFIKNLKRNTPLFVGGAVVGFIGSTIVSKIIDK